MLRVDVDVELVSAGLREARGAEVDRDRQLQVLGHARVRAAVDLQLGVHARHLFTVLAEHEDLELVRDVGLGAVELQHRARGTCPSRPGTSRA